MPAPSAPNAELKLAAKFWVASVVQHRLVDRQRWLRAGGADARPVVLEHQVLADVEGRLDAVAVPVGGGRRQRHQVVRRQTRRIIGIGGVGMHHGADLVERDVAIGGDADREHQLVGRGRAAFDHGAVERQVDRLAGGRVGQPGGTRHHAQRIGQRAGTISAKRRAEVGGKVLVASVVQHRLVDRQRRLRAGGADARPVVLEHQVLADVERRLDAVAVPIGDGRRQRHQIVRGQTSSNHRDWWCRDAPRRGSGRA